LYHAGEIRNEAGDLLARGEGRFVVIDREKYQSRRIEDRGEKE
jgi:acyl-CoA thioesterase FadM